MEVKRGEKLFQGLQGVVVADTGSLQVHTEAPGFVDITEPVVNFVEESGMLVGLLTIFSKHTTAAIVVQEKESMLMKDINLFLESLAPRNGPYHHNNFELRTENMQEEESPNGHAHLQHMLLGSSQAIPIVAGKLALGRWQRIFLVELDSPRDREVQFLMTGFQVSPVKGKEG